MSNSSKSSSVTAATGKVDENLVFSVMMLRARRKLLVALAMGGAQTTVDLMHVGKGRGSCTSLGSFVDSTGKNLSLMMRAGIVVQSANPNDPRRPLYALAPSVKVSAREGQTILDFGFLVVRVSPDGN